jgi:hypothetical protein
MKFVYLIFSEETGIYKVGVSKNPSKRLKQLQTGNSEKLVLKYKYESEYYNLIEKYFHSMYTPQKKEGEWFEFTLEHELRFLAECEKVEKNIKILKENQNEFI